MNWVLHISYLTFAFLAYGSLKVMSPEAAHFFEQKKNTKLFSPKVTNKALKQTDLLSFDLIWLHMAWIIFPSQNPKSRKDWVREHGPKEGVGRISSRFFFESEII